MRSSLAALVCMLCALVAAPAALGADPLRDQQWGLDAIEADAAHARSTGTGAVVAVIDTGVDADHEDLQGRLLPGYDFAAEPDDSDPNDGDGHGTHVTGIIAANAGNGIGVESVAPGAKVLPIRVLDDEGSGTSEDVAKGIDYAVAHGADVINLSLGGDVFTQVLGEDEVYVKAVNDAIKAGVIVVAAAGNDTLPFCEQPATEGKMLCVGAVDRDNFRAFYSSSGDLVAPGGSAASPFEGDDILSTYKAPENYAEIAGTSQATPHVAGVAALLVSLGLKRQAVIDRILATTKDLGMPGPDSVYGAGLLDAKAAVAGLGGGGGGGGGGGANGGSGGAAGSISVRRRHKIRTVLKRGIRMRCTAPKAGRCSVRVRGRGRLIAKGARTLSASKPGVVRIRATRKGRRLLKRRSVKTVRAKLTATLPNGAKRTRRLVLVR